MKHWNQRWNLRITPWLLMGLVLLAVLTAEGITHLILEYIPYIDPSHRNIVDMTLVLMFIGIIFSLSFGTLKTQWDNHLWSQEELRLNQERLHFALEGSQTGLWDWDIRTGKTYFSPRWVQMLGFDPGEIPNDYQSWENRLHPNDREKTIETLNAHVRGETEHYEAEFRMRTKQGNWVWIHDRGQVVERDPETGQALRAVGTHSNVTDRKNAEQEVRHLSRQLLIAAEDERKRLATDLHDEFGQTLVALQMGLEMLKNNMEPPDGPLVLQCNRLIALSTTLVQEVREFCSMLRPTILDDLGFIPALHWLQRQFTHQIPGIEINLTGFNPSQLAPEVEVTLYRVCQEGLNNIAQHAGAQSARITLESRTDVIQLFIQDDGRGFTPASPRFRNAQGRGLGVIGMKERVDALGGSFSLKSTPGEGTIIQVELPFLAEETS